MTSVLTHRMRRNDLLPVVTVTATYSDGTPVDLSTATSPEFHMRPTNSSTVKVDATATVTDGANGVISYSWQGTDTDTAGVYLAEFEVQIGGKRLTLPGSQQKLRVVIREDIA